VPHHRRTLSSGVPASLALRLARQIVGSRAPLEISPDAKGPVSNRPSRPIVCPQATRRCYAKRNRHAPARGRMESRPEKEKKDDAPTHGMTVGDGAPSS
jgi:hypothetical protein